MFTPRLRATGRTNVPAKVAAATRRRQAPALTISIVVGCPGPECGGRLRFDGATRYRPLKAKCPACRGGFHLVGGDLVSASSPSGQDG